MTLTTILPSLRRSIPDPFVADRWPEHTSVTTTDVVVAGVPMRSLVELCGTPCVHTAAAVVPGSGGCPSPDQQATVIVVTVESVSAASDGLLLSVDASMAQPALVWSELRLIGRASTAHSVPFTLDDGTLPVHQVSLPRDLRIGDLLAVPCAGCASLRDLRLCGPREH